MDYISRDMSDFNIRRLAPSDKAIVSALLISRWGSTKIVTRGVVYDADLLPGFVATQKERIVGLITYRTDETGCEIISLDSLREKLGIGSALIDSVKRVAVDAGCTRLWLITTNDNVPAINYYKKRGFTIAAVHEGAIKKSRKLKPSIPLIGIAGIPITDEVEMEICLA